MLFRSALVLVLVPLTVEAQSRPSASYLPLDHWAVPHLEYLVDRGTVTDPSPMVRPWTVGAIAAALAEADTAALTRAELVTWRALRDVLRPPERSVVGALEVEGRVQAATHARRRSLREAGDGAVVPQFGINAALQLGAVVLVVHPFIDPNLEDDPDYGGRDQPIDGRAPEAYLGFRSRYLDLDFGSLSRNWGPAGLPGLLLSDWPHSYDHFYARAGTERVFLQMTVAQLDNLPDQNGEDNTRYWVTHRLAARPATMLDVAVWEGSVIAGPDRGLELWYLNPLRLQTQTEDEQNQSTNVLVGADVEFRPRRGWRIAGSIMVDDLQLLGVTKNDEPASYGLTATVSGRVGPGSLWLGYTQVANLSYRTPNPAEALLVSVNPDRGRAGTGLARNFSDYDQFTARLTVMARPGVLLSPEITLLRQGEGDLRSPFPPVEENAVTPTLFDGVVERTWRLALAGSVALHRNIAVAFDAGVHRILNEGHVEGSSDTELVAKAVVRVAFGGTWESD